MKVNEVVDYGGGHRIEFGTSSWDDTEESVRDRWPTRNGGFSPHSSSEVPLRCVELLAVETLCRDKLGPAATVNILRAAVESLARRLAVAPERAEEP
jgi:hypothetical protein